MNEDQIGIVFGEAVDAYRQLPKSITVSSAILSLTGCRVIPLNGDEPADADLIKLLTEAADHCMRSLGTDPILSKRVNEVGNLFEPRLKASCETVGMAATWPEGSRSGYPDLLVHDAAKRPSYIEVKTVGPGQELTTFRSFYLSPSERPKVRVDARHILVAFAHKVEGVQNGLTAYSATSFKIVDLHSVWGNIKFEYQSSNSRVYAEQHIVSSGSL